jgi:hypothetical protein
MKNLKYLALIGLLLIGFTNTDAQLKIRFATNVRYIAGGYIDQRPLFNTLEKALNDVLPYATVNNPYVFWVDSDTIQIADWDSVFTGSGLTMKDSIDIYYVTEGKIKWGGFGFGGTGGGSTVIPSQTQTTTHYDYPNWDKDNGALASWLRLLAQAVDSVDQHIWELIVYTDSVFLYIEDDTLKLRTSAITALIDSIAGRPDTTIIAYKTIAQTISGNWSITGDMAIGTNGSFRIPDANYNTGISRILWSNGGNIYFSGSGVAGDTSQLAEVTTTTGLLRNTVVGYGQIVTAVYDSIKYWLKPPHLFLTEATYTPNVTGGGTYVKITPAFAEEEKYRVTFAGDTATVASGAGGDYVIAISFTIQNAAADDFTLQIRKNNVTAHSVRFTGAGASEYVTVSTWEYFDGLVPGDDISFYITNTIDADDPVMTNINVYLHRSHE